MTGCRFRSDLMSYGGPSEGLSTVRGHRPLEWRSLPQFSLFCSLTILEPGLECSCLLRVADRQGSPGRGRGGETVRAQSAMTRIRSHDLTSNCAQIERN